MNELKYLGYSIVFQEVPNEVTLAINISGCPHHCEGCHSKHLWDYEGDYISDDIEWLIDKYNGLITCVCFMGGDQNQSEMLQLIHIVRSHGLKVALYSGYTDNDTHFIPYRHTLDYLKIGPYIDKLGGLDKPTTNQRMYAYNSLDDEWEDITYKFQEKYI